MVLGGSSKPSYRPDLSAPEKVVSKERMPKSRWSSESGGDNRHPMMMYQSVHQSDSQGAESSPFGVMCDGKTKKSSDDSTASSTITLTSSCCAINDLNNRVPDSHDDEEKMKDSHAAEQFSKRTSDLNLPDFISSQHSPALGHYEASHIKIHAVSSSEISSGTSVSSAVSISTSSSVDSKLFYPDQEKSVSKTSTCDSPISSCTLSVANFTNASGCITSGLISTAYSRLRDKDLLYKKRIKELEKQVKKVPILEMKLKAQKDENDLLLQQLKYFSETGRDHEFSDSSAWSNQTCCPSCISAKQADNNRNFIYCANNSGSVNNLDQRDYSPNTKLAAIAEVQTGNSQMKGEIGLENENPMQLAATLFDLPSSGNSRKRDECSRFCIKCPNCCYRISNESLQMSVMKDQNVQTDPSLFTLERSTQTSGAAALKNQHFRSFFQNLDDALSENGQNGSEPTANDQILNVMKYIAYLIRNDTELDGNPSLAGSPSGHIPQIFHSNPRDSLNSESSNVQKAEENSAAPLKVESAHMHSSNESDPGVTKSTSNNVMFDSTAHKIQEKNDHQLRKSPSRKQWMNDLGKSPSKHVRPRVSLNPVLTSQLVSPPDGCELASVMDQGQRPKFRSQQMPMAADTSKNDGVFQHTLQNSGPKHIGDMSEAVHRRGAQTNLTLGVIVESDDIKNTTPDAGGCAGSALFSVNLHQESEDRYHSGPVQSKQSANAILNPSSSVSNKKMDLRGSLREKSKTVEVEAPDEELLLSDELRDALQIVENYLGIPGKANTLSEKVLVKGSYDLIKKHWFEELCCASPSYVRKYLGILAQYSSVLLQWIFGQQDIHGNTIVHLLVANRNFAGLHEVLGLGFCDLNKFNKIGYTAAMIACTITDLDGCDMQVMKKLFQMSDLNLNSHKYGETALSLACGHGMEDIVKLLLESGADINAQDGDGSTALMYAAEKNYMHIVKQLINHPDCDLHITDRDGIAAWAVAMKAQNRNIGLLLFYNTFYKACNPQKIQECLHEKRKCVSMKYKRYYVRCVMDNSKAQEFGAEISKQRQLMHQQREEQSTGYPLSKKQGSIFLMAASERVLLLTDMYLRIHN